MCDRSTQASPGWRFARLQCVCLTSQLAVIVPKTGNVGQVKAAVAEQTGIALADMVVCEIFGHRVDKQLEDDDGISSFTARDPIVRCDGAEDGGWSGRLSRVFTCIFCLWIPVGFLFVDSSSRVYVVCASVEFLFVRLCPFRFAACAPFFLDLYVASVPYGTTVCVWICLASF